MVRLRVLALSVAALVVGACHIQYTDGPEGDIAHIALTVAPDPLRMLVVCPPGSALCFGSLDATVTIVESNGVGGRIESLDITLYNVTTARNETEIKLGPDWLRAQVGTDRIAANGAVAVRPIVEGYPFQAGVPRPQLEFLLAVSVTDDRGNAVRQTSRVPLL